MSTSNITLTSPELEATGGRAIRLDEFAGKPVVIYFYPRDNTPGCTKEGEAFRDLHDEFAKADCRILGVSRDSLKSHEKFADKYDFPFPLIADPDETLCRQFDVIKEKNMYGKKVMGIERSTFLFDADGKLVREWRKVRVPGHVEEVLDAVRELA
ncbi:peroxiredoxin [Wenzhouxiangella sediminis]|uniref:thioredoxin-dependent peroxiredoxin n=1 Tax=Wenzhouxiangella sediminis TaxID=1792836 RepID=A0A3E1K6G6_9GAMM|nr:peroxiredoxin [Wenzhouxiangella sediminis]RFF29612.1 peroxiredoxin [Wenzhouxiangella sediminis]